MKVEVRLSDSGHSERFSQLSTVQTLMQQIRKNFKIEIEDQKIILKTGETLKSSMCFENVNQLMTQTISSNAAKSLNSRISQNGDISRLHSVYVYNQKQLLRPIQCKVDCSREAFLNTLRQKTEENSLLADNSYEIRQYDTFIEQSNIENSLLESLSKKIKIPFSSLDGLKQKYSLFIESISKIGYYKLLIQSLLQLIQNQDKARKLLFRNVEFILDNKGKNRMKQLSDKIQKQQARQTQIILKENSSFFSESSDKSVYSDPTVLLVKHQQAIAKNIKKFSQKLKQQKRQLIKKFNSQQKLTIQIDSRINKHSKQSDFNQKELKQDGKTMYRELIEQLKKCGDKKEKEKDIKTINNIAKIQQKITKAQSRVQASMSQLSEMFIELSKVQINGEYKSIKQVFEQYVQLIKMWDQIDSEMRNLQKQINTCKQEKNLMELQNSQLCLSKGNIKSNRDVIGVPLKGIKKSPVRKVCSQSPPESQSKEKENSIPKVNSPIRSKIGKNTFKGYIPEQNSPNVKKVSSPKQQQQSMVIDLSQAKKSKQLLRRLNFTKRMAAISTYCEQMCSKEQELRRKFKNSKYFKENQIKQLNNFNVPSLEVDYAQTSDQEIYHKYRSCLHSSQQNKDSFWESQLIQSTNMVNRTLTIYLASKSNINERQRNLERILSILSQTFHTLMKKKIAKQTQFSKLTLKQQSQRAYQDQILKLKKDNQSLNEKLWKMQQELEDDDENTSIRLSQNICRIQQIQKKEKELAQINQRLEQQNACILGQNKKLKQKLDIYQLEMNEITQKLLNIEKQQQSRIKQTKKVHTQLQTQKGTNFNLKSEISDLSNKLENAKKNLVKQMDQTDMLINEIAEIQNEKKFYESEFNDLKLILADREVQIIRLENKLKIMQPQSQQQNEKVTCLKQAPNQIQFRCDNLTSEQHVDFEVPEALRKEFLGASLQSSSSQRNNIKNQCACQCFSQLAELKQEKSILEEQIQQLKQQLRNICQITEDQQTQTDDIQQPGKEDSALIYAENQSNTKTFDKNKAVQQFSAQQMGSWCPNPVMSQYYVQSLGTKQAWGSTLPKFDSILIGKFLEQGQLHLFLPCYNDLYVGVTFPKSHNQNNSISQHNHHASLSHSPERQYFDQPSSIEAQNILSNGRQIDGPLYVLDLSCLSEKGCNLLKQCPLVLVVRVSKLKENFQKKVMVSGKVQFAMSFVDDELHLTDYSSVFV